MFHASRNSRKDTMDMLITEEEEEEKEEEEEEEEEIEEEKEGGGKRERGERGLIEYSKAYINYQNVE